MINIMVTGVAGFIGFHFAKKILNDGYNILGIDNINNYYDPCLKQGRLDELTHYSNFSFTKVDISNRDEFETIFKSFKPKKVIHLAAQAGVRYSIENPYVYLDSNLTGFVNILELCRHNDVEGLIYASSSSVYGKNIKIPFSTDDITDQPISLYGATKKSNELLAHAYSHLYGLHTTGLRYFTVYGSWGRPDMAYYIFTNKIVKNQPIMVYNNGNMKRDFTYIDDIILGTQSAMELNFPCEIFNLGNNKSENLMDMIEIIEKYLGEKAKIDFYPMQPGDVVETFADISRSTKMLNYVPKINIEDGIPVFINWYKDYNKRNKCQ